MKIKKKKKTKKSQMTQGPRRTNQMEFKARPNIAGECLDIFQYKI